MKGEFIENSEEGEQRGITRREALKKLLVVGVMAATAENVNSRNTELLEKMEAERLRQIAEYGVTGKKLPMMILSAIKGMPKGQELNEYQVVFIKDLKKFLEKKVPDDPQLKRLYSTATAMVLGAMFPIYVNGNHPKVQQELKDPYAKEVLVANLIHEKYHITNPDAPHSENYRIQADYLEAKMKKGIVPPRYKDVLQEIRKTELACVAREQKRVYATAKKP